MQLPLWAYLLASSVAIGVLAIAVRWLRPGAAPAMTPEAALRLFREDFPRVESTAAEMTPDGRTAIVFAPTGGIAGCVTLIGLRWTARRIGARDVASVSVSGERTVVRFDDFAWPSLNLGWRTAAQARDWAARFDAMRRPDHA